MYSEGRVSSRRQEEVEQVVYEKISSMLHEARTSAKVGFLRDDADRQLCPP